MCLVRLAQVIQYIKRKEKTREKYEVIQVLTTIPIIFSRMPKKEKKKRKKQEGLMPPPPCRSKKSLSKDLLVKFWDI